MEQEQGGIFLTMPISGSLQHLGRETEGSFQLQAVSVQDPQSTWHSLPKSHKELPLGSPKPQHPAGAQLLHPSPSVQTSPAVSFSVLHDLKFLARKPGAHPP